MHSVLMRSLEQAIAEECKRQGKNPAELTSVELDGRCRATNCTAASGLDCVKVLSLCNTGVSSLASFPALRNLETLRLSDNKLSGGLEHLVSAGLTNLRSLDLAGNAICKLEHLAPLKQLRVKSLDLDGCPVKDLPDIVSKLFGMLEELEYLDNIDRNGIERDGDEDEDEEEDDDYEGEDGGDDGEGDEGGEGEEGDNKAYAALLNAEPLGDDEEEYEDEGEDDEDDEDFDEGEEEDDDDEDDGGSAKKRKRAADDDAGRDDDDDDDDDDDAEEEG